MGYWMKGEKPTLEEKIEFARDAGGIHLYWADRIRTNPASVPPELGILFGSPAFFEPLIGA